jgi:ribosomal protein S18 acetylase RimI-like enzyme
VPALAMYRRLGFQEVGRSFAGIFELVWLELLL